MAIEHVKSLPIINLDATPSVVSTTGEGAAAYCKEITGSLVVPAAASVDSTFRFVRIPTNSKVKRVRLVTADQGGGAINIGVYWPTTGRTAMPDLAANAIDADLFAAAATLAPSNLDVTNESGNYGIEKWNTELWQVVGLAQDPGGFFDIVGTVSTAITTGAAPAGLSVEFAL